MASGCGADAVAVGEQDDRGNGLATVAGDDFIDASAESGGLEVSDDGAKGLRQFFAFDRDRFCAAAELEKLDSIVVLHFLNEIELGVCQDALGEVESREGGSLVRERLRELGTRSLGFDIGKLHLPSGQRSFLDFAALAALVDELHALRAIDQDKDVAAHFYRHLDRERRLEQQRQDEGIDDAAQNAQPGALATCEGVLPTVEEQGHGEPREDRKHREPRGPSRTQIDLRRTDQRSYAFEIEHAFEQAGEHGVRW